MDINLFLALIAEPLSNRFHIFTDAVDLAQIQLSTYLLISCRPKVLDALKTRT